MSTNVPALTFGPKGFVAVAEADILAGRLADFQDAFGADLSTDLTTPQGQLASSETAIIGDANAAFLALANGVDPAVSSGRLQDAIGRLYFIDRIPAASTVVTVTCVGKPNTPIPAGSQAVDQANNVYASTESVRIGAGGSVSVTFACSVTGPIACPTGYLNRIYRAIPGWDTVTNPSAGVLGRNVETPADFEYRRGQSVAKNAQGSLPSILGLVLGVPGVLDAFALENDLATANGATITASIAGTVLTVTAAAGQPIAVGQMVTGASVLDGTVVESVGSGTGGTGTYNLNLSQTVASEAMHVTQFGVVMARNSIYIAAYGGAAQAIGEAIWTKKSPGCGYNGNTTVTVVDTGSGYEPPYPNYAITFNIPDPTPILFSIVMQANADVPDDAEAQVRAAVTQSFTGGDKGPRARIGSALFAMRYASNISALGAWAQIFSIQLGIAAANQSSIRLRGDQVPTITDSDITVTFTG